MHCYLNLPALFIAFLKLLLDKKPCLSFVKLIINLFALIINLFASIKNLIIWGRLFRFLGVTVHLIYASYFSIEILIIGLYDFIFHLFFLNYQSICSLSFIFYQIYRDLYGEFLPMNLMTYLSWP